jgi:hypothetical protein
LHEASEAALISEYEDDDVVHVEEPSRRSSRVYGGSKHAESTENLGPSGGNTPDAGGFIVEKGYGVPILASDEVAKEPLGYELQPAVSPAVDNSWDNEHSYNPFPSGGNSRPASRPSSVHGNIPEITYQGQFDREARSTPLDNVEEYEPLFPEDEDGKPQHKPATHADRMKSRPDLKNKKFPSRGRHTMVSVVDGHR